MDMRFRLRLQRISSVAALHPMVRPCGATADLVGELAFLRGVAVYPVRYAMEATCSAVGAIHKMSWCSTLVKKCLPIVLSFNEDCQQSVRLDDVKAAIVVAAYLYHGNFTDLPQRTHAYLYNSLALEDWNVRPSWLKYCRYHTLATMKVLFWDIAEAFFLHRNE